ncbi:MAG: GNAT family N-acetyltransferase [Bdellovibrionales bacterium]|jgi:ribosomal protein S18 acetylase RimI-like enzyme|nr:GNAT family N-acetyltransferase [Bdellovibrionales bacterium]MBT3527328.1 GNAT family N-acetyltransferase [Bdellovibrionales bacterium]MBT7670233.1 GNAT family N-acetyltransferase [Bdellovibrionales bacterium]MBT7766484.1 GNAT family N-acetyltransferase [Bdellovibrionales bacterium]
MEVKKLLHQEWGAGEIWTGIVALDHQAISPSWNDQAWREMADANQHYQLFYCSGVELAVEGFTLWRKVEGDSVAHLLKIAVAHPLQRQGRGQLLIGSSIKLLKGGATSCYLEVQQDNLGAIALYHKCGFSQLHQIRGFYPEGGNALVMGMDL